ncbi:retropepsin-like aspartic protease [Sphingomonas sp.]|jgi:predicted aspartyl protease|uniref:retropepsin-like aspartic protease n=1 Tax=Sphingomonas sp. TaxID=28214 RepID=UPI002DF242D7|nr:retropepsin-like aspartic protease [Sphingomonas sp.]
MISLFIAAATLSVRGDRLYIPATINGVATEAVLDSAAEATFIDDDFARRIGTGKGKSVTAKGSGGSAEAELIQGARIDALGVSMPNLTIAVIDLDDVGQRLFGRRLDAIVGRELFDASRLSIDIEGGQIAAIPRTSQPKGVRLPLKSHHGIETMPVTIEGKAVLAEFDLGNGSDLLIGKPFAERSGLLARSHGAEKGGGIGGAVDRRIVTLRTIRIAGVTFRNVRAAIDEQPNAGDANVGVKLLRRFRIVTDFAQKAVWLQPRSGKR